MKVKLQQFMLVFVAMLFSSVAFGQFGTGDECDCSAELDPSFTFVSDPETCVVTFTADLGSDCLTANRFVWYVNGAPVGFDTGDNPEFQYESIDLIDEMQLRVKAFGGNDYCTKTVSTWLAPFTCENTIPQDFSFDVTKHAERAEGSDPIEVLYTGQEFDWVVTVSSEVDDNQFDYIEFAEVPADPLPDGTVVDCPFLYQGTASVIFPPGSGMTDLIDVPFAVAGGICLPEGDTEIRFRYKACGNGLLSGTIQWTNCIQYDPDGEVCFGFTDGGGVPTEEACSTVEIRYGCPMGMTDGYCLEPGAIEAGQEIESDLYVKRPFHGVKTFSGTFAYDLEEFTAADITMSPSFPAGFVMDKTDNGDGTIDFLIHNPLSSTATFDLGVGGLYYPIIWNGTFINDLMDCTSIYIDNVVLDNGVSAAQTPFVDPGVFCTDYENTDPPYEPAIILTDPVAYCIGGAPLTLIADGPFESENSTYVWDDGSTDQERVITTAGTYSVMVTDEDGCDRYKSIEIPFCEGECNCENFVPQIVMEIQDCEVDAVILTPECPNLDWVNYHWTFSNGNTYDGFDPPAQLFVGPSSVDPIISVKVKASIDGVLCEKELTENPFVPCRGGGGLGKLANIYPNPANDYLNVDLSEIDATTGKIEILNMQGLVLVSDAFDTRMKSTPACDVSKLRSGVYLLRLVDANNNVIEIQRLLVK
ncbi:T9SS type A sorting domain-containing protein [Gilvibacter sp.]|uniref:T9SS type A sorting domain-containing protein n=1 Tax=Gilvibacter sp. TaxID=2729997 RepID=UPI003F4A6A15